MRARTPVHLGNAGYAGIGVGRRAGRIQLDTVDEPAGPRTIDLPRRRGIRQVQRQQRLEARAGRQRRQDSFAICARRGRRVDRRLKIGHRDGPPEPLRGKLHHRGERRAVAKMHVPIVGSPQLQGVHLREAAAGRAAPGEGAGGQPRRTKSRV